jgi:Na+-driven multidrug efflux pump
MYAVGMVIVQAMNGAGDTETPMTLNLVSFWLVQIPLALALATMAGMGPDGAFIAIVVGESVLTVLSVIVFRRGGWKAHEA